MNSKNKPLLLILLVIIVFISAIINPYFKSKKKINLYGDNIVLADKINHENDEIMSSVLMIYDEDFKKQLHIQDLEGTYTNLLVLSSAKSIEASKYLLVNKKSNDVALFSIDLKDERFIVDPKWTGSYELGPELHIQESSKSLVLTKPTSFKKIKKEAMETDEFKFVIKDYLQISNY